MDLIVVSTADAPIVPETGMAAADEKIGDDITLTASSTRITVKIVKLNRGARPLDHDPIR